MKRIIFSLATLFCTLAAFSQVQQQIGFMLGGNGNLLRANSQADEKKLALADRLYGPSFGIAYDVDFYKGVGLYFGVNYTFGTQIKKHTPTVDNNHQLRTTTIYHAVSIPLELQFRYQLAYKTWITIYTGPLFQVGLKMQQIQTTEQPIAGFDPTKTRLKDYQYYYDYFIVSADARKNKFSDEDGDGRRDFNRFNPMWSVGAAFQFHQFFIRGGYSWGLSNIYYDRTYTKLSDQTLEWKRRIRHDEWSVSIGWYFAYTE